MLQYYSAKAGVATHIRQCVGTPIAVTPRPLL